MKVEEPKEVDSLYPFLCRFSQCGGLSASVDFESPATLPGSVPPEYSFSSCLLSHFFFQIEKYLVKSRGQSCTCIATGELIDVHPKYVEFPASACAFFPSFNHSSSLFCKSACFCYFLCSCASSASLVLASVTYSRRLLRSMMTTSATFH